MLLQKISRIHLADANLKPERRLALLFDGDQPAALPFQVGNCPSNAFACLELVEDEQGNQQVQMTALPANLDFVVANGKLLGETNPTMLLDENKIVFGAPAERHLPERLCEFELRVERSPLLIAKVFMSLCLALVCVALVFFGMRAKQYNLMLAQCQLALAEGEFSTALHWLKKSVELKKQSWVTRSLLVRDKKLGQDLLQNLFLQATNGNCPEQDVWSSLNPGKELAEYVSFVCTKKDRLDYILKCYMSNGETPQVFSKMDEFGRAAKAAKDGLPNLNSSENKPEIIIVESEIECKVLEKLVEKKRSFWRAQNTGEKLSALGQWVSTWCNLKDEHRNEDWNNRRNDLKSQFQTALRSIRPTEERDKRRADDLHNLIIECN